MRYSICAFFILLATFLSGCGDTTIADKVKFRIVYSEQTIQIYFQLNPDYTVKQSSNFVFEDLGTVFLKWNPDLNLNELGTKIKAHPDYLTRDWPIKKFSRFPNGKSLPSLLQSKKLKRWPQPHEGLEISLIFQPKSDLIVGGALLSDQFHQLQKNFLATQEFEASSGEVDATISIAGPTDSSFGGLYFFGNFHHNPFGGNTDLVPKDKSLSLLSPHEDIIEWELLAKAPAHVIHSGQWWDRVPGVNNVVDFLRALQRQLSPFEDRSL